MPQQFTNKQKELTKNWDSKSGFSFGKDLAEYQYNSQKYYHESPRGAPGIEIISQPSETVSELDDEQALRYALTKYVICGEFRESGELPADVHDTYESLVSDLMNISGEGDINIVAQQIDQSIRSV